MLLLFLLLSAFPGSWLGKSKEGRDGCSAFPLVVAARCKIH